MIGVIALIAALGFAGWVFFKRKPVEDATERAKELAVKAEEEAPVDAVEAAKEALVKPPLITEVAPKELVAIAEVVPRVPEVAPVVTVALAPVLAPTPKPAPTLVLAPAAPIPSIVLTPSTAEQFIAEAKERELAGWGITEAEVPAFSEIADKVNIELGGRYVRGILTPPASWTGSVTEWSRHVQAIAIKRYHQTVAKPPSLAPILKHHYRVTYLDGRQRTISWVPDPVARPNLWDFVNKAELSSWKYLGTY